MVVLEGGAVSYERGTPVGQLFRAECTVLTKEETLLPRVLRHRGTSTIRNGSHKKEGVFDKFRNQFGVFIIGNNSEREGRLPPCVFQQFRKRGRAFPLIFSRKKKNKAVDFSRTSKKVDHGP